MVQIRGPEPEAHAQFTLKGSKFIGALFPVNNASHAAEILEQVRKKYHDATHNCYAWRVYPGVEKASDDGEPSGSAGRPILQVISGAKLENVLVIVTRYFGGTKLGVGGLVRAYGDAARSVVESAPVKVLVSVTRLTLAVSYDEVSRVYHTVDRTPGIRIEREAYTGTGPAFHMRVLSDQIPDVEDKFRELLNRDPAWTILEERLDQV